MQLAGTCYWFSKIEEKQNVDTRRINLSTDYLTIQKHQKQWLQVEFVKYILLKHKTIYNPDWIFDHKYYLFVRGHCKTSV